MDIDGVPVGLDYTKVEAIESRRRVAFLNHFITHTVNFLNRSTAHNEEKLGNIDISMQRLKAQMDIFESRLRSIPGFDDITPMPPKTQSENASVTPAPVAEKSVEDISASETAPVDVTDSNPSDVEIQAQPVADDSTVPVSEHPQYSKFFNMVKYGVPIPAIKTKMALEGLNPDYLENPNERISKENTGASTVADDDDSSDSESSDGSWTE